jgi:hypothetical protein
MESKIIEPILINFVSIGKWNKFLFTGNWVSSNIFGQKPGEQFNALINPEDYEFVYEHKGILVTPKDSLVEIKIEKPEILSIKAEDLEKKIKMLNSMATKLFFLLPHTPIRASGFNVKYHIDKNDIGSKFIQNLKEKIKLVGLEQLENLTLKKVKEGYVLNTILNKINNDGAFDLTLNFHYTNKANITNTTFNEHFKTAKSLVND